MLIAFSKAHCGRSLALGDVWSVFLSLLLVLMDYLSPARIFLSKTCQTRTVYILRWTSKILDLKGNKFEQPKAQQVWRKMVYYWQCVHYYCAMP